VLLSAITLRTPVRGILSVMGIFVRRDSAVKLVDDLAGESPASADYPVGTVVISGDGAGDQTVGSPDVNVLVGRTQVWSAPTGGLTKQQVVAKANRRQASKTHPHQNRSVRIKGMPKLFYPRLKARVFGEALGKSNRRVPRGLRGRHVVKEHQGKLRTSRGLPRPMRIGTAMASRISH